MEMDWVVTALLMSASALGSFFYSQRIYGERIAKLEISVKFLLQSINELKVKVDNAK